MTRSTLVAANRTEVSKAVVHVAEFASFAFPGGTIRLTTAARNITWGGFNWLASGALLKPGSVAESADRKPRRTEIKLSALDAALRARVLTDTYHNAKVKLYCGFFTSDWVLVADPHAIAPELLMSDSLIEYDVGSGVITLSAESLTIYDQRDSAVLATPESQRRRYPGDSGQDRVASLMTTVFQWGGQYTLAGGGGGGDGGGMSAPIGSMSGAGGRDNLVGRDNSSTG